VPGLWAGVILIACLLVTKRGIAPYLFHISNV
jgi:hypothetical protein